MVHYFKVLGVISALAEILPLPSWSRRLILGWLFSLRAIQEQYVHMQFNYIML